MYAINERGSESNYKGDPEFYNDEYRENDKFERSYEEENPTPKKGDTIPEDFTGEYTDRSLQNTIPRFSIDIKNQPQRN